jgi:hypothetical protein
MAAHGEIMSEGYALEGPRGETAGIVVRQKGDRGFRFHASTNDYDALDGHVFASPSAAQRAIGAFGKSKRNRAWGARLESEVAA